MNNIEILIAMNSEIQNPLHWTKGEQNKAIDKAISALEQQLTNGWIPVDSGVLPSKPSQRVNVTLKNKMVLEVWYINDAFKFHESLSRGGLERVSEYNPVIAWQPLLKPYTEVPHEA